MLSKNRLFLPLFLFLALAIGSGAAQHVPENCNLYISPMNGFENYLSAAILTKKVPVSVVVDKSQADLIVSGSWRDSNGGYTGNGSLVAPLHNRRNFSASISIVDPKARVVFAYSSEKSAGKDLSKVVAEDWADHLRKAIKSGK